MPVRDVSACELLRQVLCFKFVTGDSGKTVRHFKFRRVDPQDRFVLGHKLTFPCRPACKRHLTVLSVRRGILLSLGTIRCTNFKVSFRRVETKPLVILCIFL